MPARLLLLEDEQAIADTLLYVLRSEGFEVVHHRLARDALAEVERQVPDLALLDVGLPDGNGFDVCRALRRSHGLPIVFLTARDDEIDRVLGLELGADDYVGKPFSPREVCARVKAVLRRTGARAAAPDLAAGAPAPAHRLLRLDEANQRIHGPQGPLPLTRLEYRLLVVLLRQPQRIFSRAELMSRVWVEAPDTADRTVDAHVKLVRGKLREAGLPADLIQTHRHMGYSLQP
ncbi:MAG: two-component system response regulator CreB [Betaproteobacteria bacterium]